MLKEKTIVRPILTLPNNHILPFITYWRWIWAESVINGLSSNMAVSNQTKITDAFIVIFPQKCYNMLHYLEDCIAIHGLQHWISQHRNILQELTALKKFGNLVIYLFSLQENVEKEKSLKSAAFGFKIYKLLNLSIPLISLTCCIVPLWPCPHKNPCNICITFTRFSSCS